MATARTLSTTELGEARYEQAVAANSWPIQVSIQPSPSDTSATKYKLVIDNIDDTLFYPTWHKDLRATVTVSIGKHIFKVYRDDQLQASDEIQVEQGEVPIGSTNLASYLDEGVLSGVTQTRSCVSGKAKVKFTYGEETHSVKEVYAIGNGVNLKLQRDDNGDYIGDGELPLGRSLIRFRVVPKEWTRPEAAAFTKFGWDACSGERGVLVSWPVLVEIQQFVDESALTDVTPDTTVVPKDNATCEGCGLNSSLIGVGVLVGIWALAILLGCGNESTGCVHEPEGGTDIPPSVPSPGKGDVEYDVLRHGQSSAL